MESAPGPIEVHAAYINDRLIVKQTIKKDLPKNGYYKEYLTLTLTPSKAINGDWDLVDAELRIKAGKRKSLLSSDFWEDVVENIGRSAKNFQSAFGNQELATYTLNPKDGPLTSFLHRIDDDRVPAMYKPLFRREYGGDALRNARALNNEYSNDPYLHLIRTDLEALAGNPDTAFELRRKWEKRYHNFPDRILQRGKISVWRNVANAQFSKKSTHNPRVLRDLFDINRGPGEFVGLEPRIKTIKEFYYSPDEPYYLDARPYVPSIEQQDPNIWNLPNFLNIQVHSKVCRILSVFYLMEGHFDEALELQASVYRMGQSLNSDGFLITRLIGIAIRAIASAGIQMYVTNACETQEDFEKAWDVLEHINNTPFQETGESLMNGENPLFISMLTPISGMFMPNFLEAQTRHKVSDVKFQLVRAALAAKYQYISSGHFPKSNKEFGHFLPDGPPKDIFNKNRPLSHRLSPENEFTVYSHGPDEVDDHGTFSYDGTNGTISGGDILVSIPRKRRYPFPKEGVRIANAAELLTQFPNGLPIDPFADTRLRPLSILESTKDKPLVIFSFGPDTDESEFKPLTGEQYKFGDITLKSVETPAPPSDAPYERSLQLVLNRAELIPPESYPTPVPPGNAVAMPQPPPGMMGSPEMMIGSGDPFLSGGFGRYSPPNAIPGHWTLDPMYDPTNGTISNGDIYIEISR
jgi:hypothetical protein